MARRHAAELAGLFLIVAKKIVPNGSGLFITQDNLGELRKSILRLARDEVLVGVPAETTVRPDAIEGGKVNNATLAYIHDNGAPEARIPQRPFMIPAIEAQKDNVTDILAKTAQYGLALQPSEAKIDEGFDRVGMAVVGEMREIIAAGIAPALAPATLRARAAKGRKGAQLELDRRAAGLPPGMDLATPLLDTGEMNKSLTWVIRRKSARSK